MTYPLIIAIEKKPELGDIVKTCVANPDALSDADLRTIIDSLESTGAISACRTLARERAQRAKDALTEFADGPGKRALLTVADAAIYREV
jgi:octaprenyl-diphosphate synthase